MDHYFQMEHNDRAEDAMLEAYSTRVFARAHIHGDAPARWSTGVSYRHRLAGQDRDDVGRVVRRPGGARIGAAWYEREHLGLGVPFPPTSERFERLEETLRVCCRCGIRRTTVPSKASTTSWRRPSTSRHPCRPRTHPS